jgi:outer membrane protein assembly factor BamB
VDAVDFCIYYSSAKFYHDGTGFFKSWPGIVTSVQANNLDDLKRGY